MKKKTILRQAAILLMASLFSTTLSARPSWRMPADIVQPDGSIITLLLHGDEYLSYTTTIDGFTVVKDADGFYRYADCDNGKLVSTGITACNPDQRTKEQENFLKNYDKHIRPDMTPNAIQRKNDVAKMVSSNLCVNPSQSTSPSQQRKIGGKRINYADFKGLVLLVEFTDRKFLRSDANAFYQDMTSKANMTGFYDTKGETFTNMDGSVRDYFRENSMGIFDPTFDVVGPIEVPFSATDAKGGDNIYPILKKALEMANQQVDYTQYDLDENGYVDMVYFLFAGYGSYIPGNNENYIWPHASDLTWYSRFQGLRFDGMMFSRYACSVEIQDLEQYADIRQNLDGIGTMCHEFSHVLGLADHYDADYAQSGGQAEHPGGWDLMASGADYNGGYTPAGYNAYERYTLGFAPLQTIDVAGQYELEPFNTSNQFYRIATGTKNEYFYVENRQKTGWDRFLPGHGLLVWRCDSTKKDVWENNAVNNNPDHMYFQLLKASPTHGIESAFTPYPGKGNVRDVTATTNPPLLAWSGSEAVVDLYDINESDNGIINFTTGKNIYESLVENFEQMAPTADDATGQKGVFTKWDLTKALIVAVENGYGNGNQVAKLSRSGTITTAPMEKSVRNVTFQAWSGNQQVKIGLRENSSGSWKYVENMDGETQTTLKKNTQTSVSFSTGIPAGTQLQVQMLATNSSAVAYIDDFTVTFDNDTQGILSVAADGNPADNRTYNLRGQRVDGHYRGIVVRDGKKHVVR